MNLPREDLSDKLSQRHGSLRANLKELKKKRKNNPNNSLTQFPPECPIFQCNLDAREAANVSV
jgi:hypothetical protein